VIVRHSSPDTPRPRALHKQMDGRLKAYW
jgi:hypothetical protein